MDFVGRKGRIGALLQQPGVIGLAIFQTPDAGIVGRIRGIGAQDLPLAIEGGIDLRLNNLSSHARIVAHNALGLGPRADRGDEPRLACGNGQHAIHLTQHVPGDEIRRCDAQTRISAHPIGFLVHHLGHVAQASKIGVSVGLCVDLMLAVEEFCRAGIGPALLADHIGASALAHGAQHGVVTEVEGCRLYAQLKGINRDGLIDLRLMAKRGVGNSLKRLELIAAKLCQVFDFCP